MSQKKKDEPLDPDRQALEKRVDSIMNPATRDSPSGVPTAPPLPGSLLRPEISPSLKVVMPVATAAIKKVPIIHHESSEETTVTVTPKKPESEAAPVPVAAEPAPADQELAIAEPVARVLDDPNTDSAVDDIVAHESDALLAAEDSLQANRTIADAPKASSSRFSHFFKHKKLIVIGIIVIILIVFGIPYSRYKLLGLVIHKTVSITIVDATTNSPVSSAQISDGASSATTSGSGQADLRVPIGPVTLTVSKQYYRSKTETVSTSFGKPSPLRVLLIATGRQVPVTVLNRINGKPIAGATISVLDTSAKTDSAGRATIVLPVTSNSDKATISLSGYNSVSAQISVTSSVVAGNTINITPSGRVYYLSNQSGTIDVMKSNLDGSDPQTVLPGTGKEDPDTTILIASPYWQYLALESRRDGTQPALYLITTSSDKLTEIDSGDLNFNTVGWSGDTFVYDEVKNSVLNSAAGHELVKSYNASTGQLDQLDASTVSGSGTDYAYQSFGDFYILSNLISYTTTWHSSGNPDVSNLNDTIRAVGPTGQNKKDYLSLPTDQVAYLEAIQDAPGSIYYAAHDSGDSKVNYYSFNGQSAAIDTTVTASSFNQQNSSFAISPSTKQSFWSTTRNGQLSLLLADQSGQNPATLAQSGYTALGWYSDNYLLLTKNSDQLYIMPVSGSIKPLLLSSIFTSNGANYGYEQL